MQKGMRVLVAVVATAAVATVAARTSGIAVAATCPPPPTAVQPFTPWSDAADYVLTTGGSFEPGSAAWQLSGGAQLVKDNAPNKLDPATDAQSLYLPNGSVATSACVTAPQIVGIVRFFTKSPVAGSQLKIEVLVKGGTYQAGTISAGSNWAPSPALFSNAPNYKGAVTYQVRLTVLSGSFTVDDVYFDPYVSR